MSRLLEFFMRRTTLGLTVVTVNGKVKYVLDGDSREFCGVTITDMAPQGAIVATPGETSILPVQNRQDAPHPYLGNNKTWVFVSPLGKTPDVS